MRRLKKWWKSITRSGTNRVVGIRFGDTVLVRSDTKSKYFNCLYLDSVSCDWDNNTVILTNGTDRFVLKGQECTAFMDQYIAWVNEVDEDGEPV